MNRDPGLQPERTALAWRRTALAMLVNGALLVRAAIEARSPAMGTVSVVVVFSALLIFGVGSCRHRTLVQVGAPRSPHAGFLILLVGAAWLACGAAVLGILA